jgi:hypothetical protein
MAADLCVLSAENSARRDAELAVLLDGNRSESPDDDVAR